MKKLRIVITVVMMSLMVLGWITQIGNIIVQNNEYKDYLNSAKEYMEQGLYQKAIEEYNSAYMAKKGNNILKKKIEAYRLSYEEGTTSMKEYAAVLEEYCKSNEKDAEGWKVLLNLYIDNAEYDSAYAVVNKCFDLGKKDEELERIMDDVIYSFKSSKKTYTKFYRSPNGYLTLYDDRNWGIMNTAGEWLYECEYQYVGSVNQNIEALTVSSLGNRVFNEDGITQAILSNYTTETKAYGSGFIPMQNLEGGWQFYSCNEDGYVWDMYKNVTSFQDGKALVYDGKIWSYIDTQGEIINGIEFNNVKMYSNGEYCYKDMFVAAQDGNYYLYDSEGEKKIEGTYKDMDIYLGEYIAFMNKDGKWGYLDEQGDIVIEAKYKNAKSFSNGLAAVFDGENWGFINKDGDLVIDYQFRDADYFTEDGICFVSTYEGLYYMITLRFN